MNEYEIIASSHLFDRESYRRDYADSLTADEDEVEHFIQKGAQLGYRPSREFDPCIYRLAYPELDMGNNPFLHYLSNPNNPEEQIDRVESIISKINFSMIGYRNIKKIRLIEHDKITVEEARKFAERDEITFDYKDSTYTIHAPSSHFLLSAIEDNIPLRIYRWPHNTLSAFASIEQTGSTIRKNVADVLNDDELRILTIRVIRKKWKKNNHWQALTENFLCELYDDLINRDKNEISYHLTAFKGPPTKDNRIFIYPGVNISNDKGVEKHLKYYASLFQPDEKILDATYFKRGVVSGGFKHLPDVCRNRTVLFMGPKWFDCLGKRWALGDYVHIPIHWEGSFLRRHEHLRECRKILESVHGRQGNLPVFFMQVGALSNWLIKRLVPDFPDCIYLDIGQAINAWVLDDPFNNLMYGWTDIYRESMVKNLGLEGMYRNLCAPCYEEWLNA